jgi:hypothetical protein
MSVPAMRLVFVRRWPRPFFEHLAIPDGALARIAGNLEVLRQLQRVHRAGIFAEAAEHATGQVVREGCEDLVLRLRIALAADENQLFGARDRTKIASDAQGFIVIGIDVQTRSATVSLGDLGAVGRILLGSDLIRALVPECDAKAAPHVPQQNPTYPFLHRTYAPARHAEIGSPGLVNVLR